MRAYRAYGVKQTVASHDHDGQAVRFDAAHLALRKVGPGPDLHEVGRALEERVVVDRGADAEREMPADVGARQGERVADGGDQDRRQAQVGRSAHHERGDLDDHDRRHRQPMHGGGPPLEAARLVMVG